MVRAKGMATATCTQPGEREGGCGVLVGLGAGQGAQPSTLKPSAHAPPARAPRYCPAALVRLCSAARACLPPEPERQGHRTVHTETPNSNLYCINLPLGWTDETLRATFSQHGGVLSTKMLTALPGAPGKGGMVRMATMEEVRRRRGRVGGRARGRARGWGGGSWAQVEGLVLSKTQEAGEGVAVRAGRAWSQHVRTLHGDVSQSCRLKSRGA